MDMSKAKHSVGYLAFKSVFLLFIETFSHKPHMPVDLNEVLESYAGKNVCEEKNGNYCSSIKHVGKHAGE